MSWLVHVRIVLNETKWTSGLNWRGLSSFSYNIIGCQMDAVDEFKRRLQQDWLVPFCQARGYSREGFDGKAVHMLGPADAADFLEAVDKGLVSHQDGIFSSAQSKAKEQIFWQGARDSVPRKVTLWIEPIITIAGLMRLHRDFLWPANQLGLQSKTWAFDLVAYDVGLGDESLVCEVKKTEREVDTLLKFMEQHINTSPEAELELKGPEQNAFKKVLGLRESASTVFWALGPNRYGYVFNVVRNQANSVSLQSTTESALLAHS